MTTSELIQALTKEDPAGTGVVTVGGKPAHDLIVTRADESKAAIPVGIEPGVE